MSDLFSVSGKVALVTGATSGIGLMIAEGFVEAGARVYVLARNAEDCKRVATELSATGEARPLPGDLSTLAGIVDVMQRLSAQETRLDVLVNNAGMVSDQPLDEFSEESWDRVVDLNLKAAFFMVQKALPLLRAAASAQNHATVVNIGSVGGLRVGPRETYAYAAAKAGLHHMTKSLAKRLGRENITVNALAPGFFPSRMTQIPDEMMQGILAQVPRGRIGEPDDVAGASLFLASRAASFITGNVIAVDGGMTV